MRALYRVPPVCVQKPLPPRVVPEAGQEFRVAVLFDAERRVANNIMSHYGSIGQALQSFDRNKNGVVRAVTLALALSHTSSLFVSPVFTSRSHVSVSNMRV